MALVDRGDVELRTTRYDLDEIDGVVARYDLDEIEGRAVIVPPRAERSCRVGHPSDPVPWSTVVAAQFLLRRA